MQFIRFEFDRIVLTLGNSEPSQRRERLRDLVLNPRFRNVPDAGMFSSSYYSPKAESQIRSGSICLACLMIAYRRHANQRLHLLAAPRRKRCVGTTLGGRRRCAAVRQTDWSCKSFSPNKITAPLRMASSAQRRCEDRLPGRASPATGPLRGDNAQAVNLFGVDSNRHHRGERPWCPRVLIFALSLMTGDMWLPPQAATARSWQGPSLWSRTESQHFEIHYLSGLAPEADRVVRSAERAYEHVTRAPGLRFFAKCSTSSSPARPPGWEPDLDEPLVPPRAPDPRITTNQSIEACDVDPGPTGLAGSGPLAAIEREELAERGITTVLDLTEVICDEDQLPGPRSTAPSSTPTRTTCSDAFTVDQGRPPPADHRRPRSISRTTVGRLRPSARRTPAVAPVSVVGARWAKLGTPPTYREPDEEPAGL